MDNNYYRLHISVKQFQYLFLEVEVKRSLFQFNTNLYHNLCPKPIIMVCTQVEWPTQCFVLEMTLDAFHLHPILTGTDSNTIDDFFEFFEVSLSHIYVVKTNTGNDRLIMGSTTVTEQYQYYHQS